MLFLPPEMSFGPKQLINSGKMHLSPQHTYFPNDFFETLNTTMAYTIICCR
jgi:hypothetical protein